ncbi:hypothetical protein [Aequorivita marisscotiae]|uniref:DUF3592 domain-containing protein n=1 Tax=Aequorivita marisscotiae TaxID=3040348 RepID=A0ABY8KQR0_9FLAO|nr:hypothetical protein [Aequorivita sp. Ant34-E75]WGF91466.1 hypothetical protein QCQ61_09610 [Aequorivita sp. Ant34-E75]
MKIRSTTLRKLGWSCFGLMWIPFFTMFAGLYKLPSGSYYFNELPQLTQYSLIALSILFILTFVFFIGSVIISKISKNRLLQSGKEAPAIIKRVYETGTTVNNSYMVGFDLEVMPKNAPKFYTSTEQLISRLQIHKFEVGTTVLVAYDAKTQVATIIGELEQKLNP